jgi:hypothetical protein
MRQDFGPHQPNRAEATVTRSLLRGIWIEGATLHDVIRTSFFLADTADGDRQERQDRGTDHDDSRCSDDRHREPPTRWHVFIAKPDCRAP